MTASPPAGLSSRFDDALTYASRLHARQVRKGTRIPYVSHLLSVAALVLEHGGDEDQAIAGLLHDAVEDQGGQPRLEEIRQRFGERVAGIVEACSDSDEADPTKKVSWRERKERYLEHLREAPPEVLLVSAADKLHNARAILADYRTVGESLWSRFSPGRHDVRDGRDAVLWYYRALVEIFLSSGPAALAEELARVVDELESLAL
jgi:(p)ppGpp synthase/HD superfamily hydrolase